MKRISYIPLFLLLLLSSCSQDEEPSVSDDEICFYPSVPGVETRTTYDLADEIRKYGITVTAFCPEDDPDGKGILDYHCKGAVVRKDVDGKFRSADCRWPGNRGEEKDGHLKFFAFHPLISEMRLRAGVGSQYFAHSNNTKKDASGISYDYRLTKFRIAPDISRQVDFVTAIGEGNKSEHLYSGVELDFEHQLCGVQISVWGASSLYDVEVAGVRIGGTVVEADFGMSVELAKPANDENTIGQWYISSSSPRGHVDYIFGQGDEVVRVNVSEHNTKGQAASIMGLGGKAMLIPYRHDKWDYVHDKENNARGMYFSVLIHMTEHDGDHHRIFPSTEPESRASLVYLLVNKSDGKVIRRLSSAEYDSFTPPSGQEKRAYGWAAVPANVEWKPGYTYSYVLDYSNGVGVHDPADENKASTIVDWDGVGITNSLEVWGDGDIIQTGGWGANTNNTAEDGTVWWK